MARDHYTHGHHESVLRSHRWRTAANSAGFLLPHLRAGLTLLDVGCGPGTITADLSRLVGDGEVMGIDRSSDVVAAAAADFPRSRFPNLRFTTGDVYQLDFADESFDVVYAHQVLQHLADPVAALGEMRRVLRVDGILAVRDADYGAFVWFPADPVLDRWLAAYHRVTERNSACADAGRQVHAWVRRAGFTDMVVSSSNWTYATDAERAWWGGLWADRLLASDLARQLVDYGVADADELAEYADAFRRWAEDPDGIFVVPNGEVLARR